MNVYFAARYSKRPELRRYRQQLADAGHNCTSTWLDADAEENTETALRDLLDVARADSVILFAEKPRCRTRGGRFVEYGYALALGKTAIVIGGIENIFVHLADQQYTDWAAFLKRCCGRTADKRPRLKGGNATLSLS